MSTPKSEYAYRALLAYAQYSGVDDQSTEVQIENLINDLKLVCEEYGVDLAKLVNGDSVRDVNFQILLEGGLVQSVCSDNAEGLRCGFVTLDYDTDAADSEVDDIVTVTQPDGSTFDAVVTHHTHDNTGLLKAEPVQGNKSLDEDES